MPRSAPALPSAGLTANWLAQAKPLFYRVKKTMAWVFI
jgi:hypothetical protein